MIIQNIHNPRVKQEISKQKWAELGSKQKIFRILDKNDSDHLKQQTISNSIGKTKEEVKKEIPKSEPNKPEIPKEKKSEEPKKS